MKKQLLTAIAATAVAFTLTAASCEDLVPCPEPTPAPAPPAPSYPAGAIPVPYNKDLPDYSACQYGLSWTNGTMMVCWGTPQTATPIGDPNDLIPPK